MRSGPQKARRELPGGCQLRHLKVMGAHKIVVLAPYMKALTKLVVDYIANEGYEAQRPTFSTSVARGSNTRLARSSNG